MLWSLLKVILFVGIVAAAAFGASTLMETQGGVTVAAFGTEITLGPLQSVLALLLLVVAAWILFKVVGLLVAFLRFLTGDETAWDRYRARSREKKGYDALTEGLMALASGDGRAAMTKASKAANSLPNRPELTTLLTAQAAEMVGDKSKATEAYKALLTEDKTRFVGVRGLLKQKLAEGDTATALKLAEKAFSLKPRDVETQDTLLQLQANEHDWTAARKTLAAKLKHGALPRDVHKRRDAVLALGEAKDVMAEDNTTEAREAAIEANRLSPDLVPAAVIAADGYIAQNKPKNATRVIKKAWEAQPHPDLAAAFARIQPDESPAARVRRFALLTNQRPNHSETKMLNAELAIAADDFPGARRALGDLVETDPTARSLTIMAAIERGSGADDAVVKGWLARALNAPRGPQWVCDNCQKAHAQWDPVCDACNSLDTLTWRRPESSGTTEIAADTQMLPLIVGQIEQAEEEAEEVAATEEPMEVTPPSETANADTPPAGDIIDSEPLKKDGT